MRGELGFVLFICFYFNSFCLGESVFNYSFPKKNLIIDPFLVPEVGFVKERNPHKIPDDHSCFYFVTRHRLWGERLPDLPTALLGRLCELWERPPTAENPQGTGEEDPVRGLPLSERPGHQAPLCGPSGKRNHRGGSMGCLY